MAREFHTILRGAKIPWQENDTSRRYLHMLHTWVPTAISYFNDWPQRPNCGYFYGGCGWYGEETAGAALVFALAASSPEYDPSLTGCSRHALRMMAYKGLRYLCFVHDTGPADCIRPAVGLGRSDCCGNKWGERGSGFFPESQCGVTLGQMAIVAICLSDLLDDETWTMLERLFLDYAERFTNMAPRSGVYLDTQMEENAWTSLGLAASGLLLGHHPLSESILASARRWMFLTATTPQDAKNKAVWHDGKRISEHVFKTFTTLPDYMAENHGIVHPTYTASAMTFLLQLSVLFSVYSLPLPEEALFNRAEVYSVLKQVTDRSGQLHPMQGMDWPYLRTTEVPLAHAAAALVLHDQDGAYLEQLSLARAEQVMASSEGCIYQREISEHVSNIQDPLIAWEYHAFYLAYAYAAHRLLGPAPEPTPMEAFEKAHQGIKVLPHTGVVFHRHPAGQTSFSWRNAIMALPLGKDGLFTIAPASGSILAQVGIQGQPESQRLVSCKLDEHHNRLSLNLVMDRCQDSLRQHVLFASLPDGTSILLERLDARKDIRVNYVKQGFMRIINENYACMPGNCSGSRMLYSARGEQLFRGYVATDLRSDIRWQATGVQWLNIDDRMGIVFQAQGPTTYLNRHYFSPWWAVADDLYLGQLAEPQAFAAGDRVAEIAALYLPNQPHGETADQEWHVLQAEGVDAHAILANGYMVAASWEPQERDCLFSQPRSESDGVAVTLGNSLVLPDKVVYRQKIDGYGTRFDKVVAFLQVEGTLEIEALQQGKLWLQNPGKTVTKVSGLPSQPLTLAPGEVAVINL